MRINIAKEVVAVLMALAESQPPERFTRDLAIVNFGLHYGPDKGLKNDVDAFHRGWIENKVRPRRHVSAAYAHSSYSFAYIFWCKLCQVRAHATCPC